MNLRSRFTLRQVLLLGCSFCFLLALLSLTLFAAAFLEQYRKEKILSSVERNLPELSSLFDNQLKAKSSIETGTEHYLDCHLSSLPLLNYERGALELLLKQRPLSEGEAKRLQFITKENRLQFQSHRKLENGGFHEIEEKLLHTVQIDENDLQAILDKIDGVGNSPSLLRIKRLSLEKIPDAPRYTLYLELWRKEL